MDKIRLPGSSSWSLGSAQRKVAARTAQLALGFLMFAGAAHADDRAALLGTWHGEQKAQAVTITSDTTFAKDGTFSGHLDRNGRRLWNFAGTWTLTGKALHYDYTKSDLAQIPAGTKDDDVLLEITPTTLKLKGKSGEETWVRKEQDKS